MARVIMFSRYFQKGHPREGEPTFFVEKLFCGLTTNIANQSTIKQIIPDYFEAELRLRFLGLIQDGYRKHGKKFHTIRSGNRWKVGDKFSPRVWEGKPYRSEQIIIVPELTIKHIWDFDVYCSKDTFFPVLNGEGIRDYEKLNMIANNDGLEYEDFIFWFNQHKEFHGQIICWIDEITY